MNATFGNDRKELDQIVLIQIHDPALPTHKQGIIVLGTPLGCTDFVEAQLTRGGGRNLVGEDPKGVRSPMCVVLVVVLCSIKSQLYSPSCPP